MISVIMSTYNESTLELSQSIDSILNQTYHDFEFIIVCDNPRNIELIELLNKYKQIDKRIRLINNQENIGLALSLNKAANQAVGDYLFRMDADDIAYPNRMMEQYKEITENNLDLVCSGYDFINEASELIHTYVEDDKYQEVGDIIPFQVAIHHPTVMMKKTFFDAVGGYRNFICAQDYDLWLRMWCAGAKMKKINMALLQYRIRKESVTFQKRFFQKITIDYIRELFLMRLQTGKDNYSYTEYIVYLEKNGAYDSKKNHKFLSEHSMLSQANSMIKQGNHIKGYFLRLKVFIMSKSYRKSYLKKFKTKRLVKMFLNKD